MTLAEAVRGLGHNFDIEVLADDTRKKGLDIDELRRFVLELKKRKKKLRLNYARYDPQSGRMRIVFWKGDYTMILTPGFQMVERNRDEYGNVFSYTLWKWKAYAEATPVGW